MTTKTAKLHITPDAVGSTIEVEGHQLEGVTSINLTASIDYIPRLTVDLRMHEVDADGEFVVAISASTAATLRTLGWTPPATDDGGALDGEAFEELLRNVYRTTVCPDPYVNALVAEAGRARAEAARLRAELEGTDRA